MNPAPEYDTGIPGDDIDLVPGDISVSFTVWRTPPSVGDQALISERLAYRLVAAYSNPGDTIVDLSDSDTIARAAARGGRGHARAAFNGDDVVVADVHPSRAPSPATVWDSHSGELLDLGDWFGDDLRDVDRPAGTTTDPRPIQGASVPGSVSLLVAMWPLDSVPEMNNARLAALAAVAVTVVRPGGCVVFVAAANRPDGGDFTGLVTGARAGGLRYLQHIVAITADAQGDHFVYHATRADLAGLRSLGHHRMHSDLVVFFTVGGDSRD
jgi:hypothetical protein